jgi:hypothetical protein
MRFETRLRRLEGRLQARPSLPVALAHKLQQAVRDTIARRLEGLDDTPEQAASLAALHEQWRAVCGSGGGARERITARLNRIAERQRAYTLGAEDVGKRDRQALSQTLR